MNSIAAGLSREVAEVRGDVAEDESDEDESSQPAEEEPSLQSPGEPKSAAEAGLGVGRAGPIGQEAGAVVASGQQCVRTQGHDGKEHDRDKEDPPPVALVRAHLLAPADRRKPAQGGGGAIAGRVADRAQHVDHAEEGHGHADGGPGAAGHLRGERGHRREGDADARPGQAERERARRRQARPDQTQRGQQPERQGGAHRHDERGGERRVAADDGRADELEPAGLLLGPRVPDHQDGGEHGDERPAEGPSLIMDRAPSDDSS